jgi:hypothetical protein
MLAYRGNLVMLSWWQKIKTKEAGKMKLENPIYCGDNLTWLKKQSSFIYQCD